MLQTWRMASADSRSAPQVVSECRAVRISYSHTYEYTLYERVPLLAWTLSSERHLVVLATSVRACFAIAVPVFRSLRSNADNEVDIPRIVRAALPGQQPLSVVASATVSSTVGGCHEACSPTCVADSPRPLCTAASTRVEI